MASVKSANKDQPTALDIPEGATPEQKEQALKTAIGRIEKTYGKGAVMKLGERTNQSVEHISTGSLGVDIALGIGGLPRGRIIEVYGAESSGKTTLALHVAAEAQKIGGTVAFIDVEHALDPSYAAKLGVNTAELLVSQPGTGEEALAITDALVRSGALDVIIIDSVAALVPKAEIDGDMGDTHVGLQARLMSQALRMLTGIISKSKCVAIFINQLRDKVNSNGYGPSETTTGGRALKFYATVRMEVHRCETLRERGVSYGNRVRVKISKNKMAPPFREAYFDLIYGKGIDRIGEIIDIGVEYDILRKSGAWYYYGESRIGQGRENTRKFLEDNPDVAKEVESKIYEKISDQSAPIGLVRADDTLVKASDGEPANDARPADEGERPAEERGEESGDIDIMLGEE